MKTKPPEPVIEHIDSRYDFNITEIGELARKMALANQRAIELEEKKKQLSKDYAAQVEAAQAEANVLGQKISNGYEMRETECVVTFDPKSSTKFYHRKRDGEYVRSAEMTRRDFELSLPFEKAKKAEEKDAGKENVGEALAAAESQTAE